MPHSLLIPALFVSLSLTYHPHHQATPATNETCPFCGLDVLKDTKDIAFRVTVTRSGRTQAYRCILCALADVKLSKDDLEIVTPSEDPNHPVKIHRNDGKWSMTPETAEFAYAKGSHEECQTRYRALTSPSALEAYRQKCPKLLSSAKALTLSDLIKRSE